MAKEAEGKRFLNQVCNLLRVAWAKPENRPALEKVIRELMSLHPSDEDWVTSWRKVGDALGHHANSFPRWLRVHADAPRSRQNGEHSIVQWRGWLAKHPEISSDEAYDRALIKIEMEKEKLREIRRINDEADGLLWPKASVLSWLTQKVVKMREILRRRSQEIAPKLEGLRAPQMSQLLADSDAEVLEEFNDLKGLN